MSGIYRYSGIIYTDKVTYLDMMASIGVEVKTEGVKYADKVAYTNRVANCNYLEIQYGKKVQENKCLDNHLIL